MSSNKPLYNITPVPYDIQLADAPAEMDDNAQLNAIKAKINDCDWAKKLVFLPSAIFMAYAIFHLVKAAHGFVNTAGNSMLMPLSAYNAAHDYAVTAAKEAVAAAVLFVPAFKYLGYAERQKKKLISFLQTKLDNKETNR